MNNASSRQLRISLFVISNEGIWVNEQDAAYISLMRLVSTLPSTSTNIGPKQVEEFLNVVGIIFPIKLGNGIVLF